MDGGRPARRPPRFAPSGKGEQYLQGGARQSTPTIGPRGQAFATPWRQTVYPPGPNILQSGARNARLGPRQQHGSAAAGSAATPQQLRERQEQHRAEQAAQAARPDAPPGRHVCLNCRTASSPTTIPTRRVLGRCAQIASGWGTPRENVSGTSSPNEGRAAARVRAGGEARLGGDRRWAVRAHVRGWLPSVLQSCRCVYPVGVTDRGLSLGVMSELALITLGRDEFPSDISRYHARSFFVLFCFSARGGFYLQGCVTE